MRLEAISDWAPRNPMPTDPPVGETMAVFSAITWPAMLKLGPPELPGLIGASITRLHRAHATSIPFENLDPHRGVVPSLKAADLERKLVTDRRGGYCFEHNLLFADALTTLGMGVETILARVSSDAGTDTPLTHLLLRVTDGDRVWHADVGLGANTLLQPIPFGPGGPHEQLGWSYRVIEQGRELVLQIRRGDAWADLYSFVPEPVPRVDIALGNWWTGAHPSSGFVTGLLIARRYPDGTRVSLSDWDELALVHAAPSGRTATPVQWADVPGLLADTFGLPGFTLAPGNRLIAETADAAPS